MEKFTWQNKVDDVDEVFAEDINAIAKAVIDTQNEAERIGNNALHIGKNSTIGNNVGVPVTGRFADLDPKQLYLIWDNAIQAFDDVGDDIKQVSSEWGYFYILPFGTKADVNTYGEITGQIPVLLANSDNGGRLGIASWYTDYNVTPNTKKLTNFRQIGTLTSDLTSDTQAPIANVVNNAIQGVKNNGLHVVGNIIVGTSSGPTIPGRFADLDPKQLYLIWNNAIQGFEDAGNDIKELGNDWTYFYLLPFGSKADVNTYGGITGQMPVLLANPDNGGRLAIASWYTNYSVQPITKKLTNVRYVGTLTSDLTSDTQAPIANVVNNAIQGVKNELQDNLKQAVALYKPYYVTDNTGTKYVISISNGNTVAIPVIPNKATFLGNSLVLGFGRYGMAASDINHDYYHYITNLNPAGTYNRIHCYELERQTEISQAKAWVDTNITQSKFPADTDLVLIQLGDNVKNQSMTACFKQSMPYLISKIRTLAPMARIVWAGQWYNAEISQSTIKSFCQAQNIQYIQYNDLMTTENQSCMGAVYTYDTPYAKTYSGLDSFTVDTANKTITLKYQAYGTHYVSTVSYEGYTAISSTSVKITALKHVITDYGVSTHPGDAGFLKIANRFAYQLGMINNEGDIDGSEWKPDGEAAPSSPANTLGSRIAALEAQLNGISFDTNENGNLTYEKQTEATE